jgi:hypothetical protein
MKLSMIVSASHGKHDLSVTMDDLQEAINLLEEAEVKMEGVFKGVGKSDIASLINSATNYLVNSRRSEIPFVDFARRYSSDMDKVTMDRVLNTLEASEIVKLINRPGGQSTIKVLETRDKIIKNLGHDVQ